MLSAFIKDKAKIEKNIDSNAIGLQKKWIRLADYDQVDQAM
jgi:hypothetical protein